MSVGYCTVKILYVIQYLIIQKSGQGEAVPAYTVKAYRGRGGIAPFILTLRTRWIWVFSFVPWPPPPPHIKNKVAFQISGTCCIASEDSHRLGTCISAAGYPRMPESYNYMLHII